MPISRELLEKITATPPCFLDDYNIDAAFKVAWAGFLRLGEMTYTRSERTSPAFADTKATRSRVSFAEGDQYAVLRLRRSKTDVDHTGVKIIGRLRMYMYNGGT